MGFGIELVQHREGHGVGRPIAHRKGEIVEGSAGVLRTEIRNALRRIEGKEGSAIRQRLEHAAAEMRSRRRNDGAWDEDLRRFVRWAINGQPPSSF